MISAAEQQALRAEVDAGSYDIQSAMSAIASATKGSKIRASLYKVVYWLKKNYTSSAEGMNTRQPLLVAGSNVTIKNDADDTTKQTISATDTKNTVGNQNVALKNKNYLVMVDSGGGSSTSSTKSYVNSNVYIDSTGAFKVGSKYVEFNKDSAYTSKSVTLSTTVLSATSDPVEVTTSKTYLMNATFDTGGYARAITTPGVLTISIEASTNNSTWTQIAQFSRNIRGSSSTPSYDPSVSITQIYNMSDGYKYLRAKIAVDDAGLDIGSGTITLGVM